MITPLFSLMYFGATFWNTLVGETMFAAVLVEMVARMIMSIDSTTHSGLSILPIRLMGSEMVWPTSSADAAVRTTPRPANSNMVSGRPMIWPMTCERCERAKRLKSGMLSDSVAQKPTIAVNAAMK
jgi:hypothetical protein